MTQFTQAGAHAETGPPPLPSGRASEVPTGFDRYRRRGYGEAMEIAWLGRTCFRIRGREGAVVTDPFQKKGSYSIGKPQAAVVTLGRKDDVDYSGGVEEVGGSPRVLNAPGEYEIDGMLITGIALPRPNGPGTVTFVVEVDGIRVAHLGLPASAPTTEQLEEMGDVDILLLPVGGAGSLGGAEAANALTAIEPLIAIPMHYKTQRETLALETLDRFLRETGAKPEPQARLQVTKSQLPAQPVVMVLEPRGA